MRKNRFRARPSLDRKKKKKKKKLQNSLKLTCRNFRMLQKTERPHITALTIDEKLSSMMTMSAASCYSVNKVFSRKSLKEKKMVSFFHRSRFLFSLSLSLSNSEEKPFLPSTPPSRRSPSPSRRPTPSARARRWCRLPSPRRCHPSSSAF